MGFDSAMGEFVKLVFQALAPIVAGLIVALLVQMLRKIGISLSAERQAEVEKSAQDIILKWEEKAATAVKNHLALPAGAKINGAVLDLIRKFPKVDAGEAENIIHAELPKIGLGAAAFLRATADALKQ